MKNYIDPAESAENKSTAKEDQTNKRFEEAQGRNEGRGQANLFLRTVTVSGAEVLRFSDIPIMCLKVCDDVEAVIWVKNA